MKAVILFAAALACASPSWAQDEPLSIRPFVMVTDQAFAASTTFDATFGKAMYPFFGGGVQVIVNGGLFVELGASRFHKSGDRAFLSGGKAFSLGIPLTATLTPFELSAGYRFRLRSLPKVRPYAAAGIGSYSYKETSSFAAAGDDVDARHTGYLVNGGAEFRLQRWIGLGVDVQYSHVPGILGAGGVSQQAGESDLGGVAARFKLIVGR